MLSNRQLTSRPTRAAQRAAAVRRPIAVSVRAHGHPHGHGSPTTGTKEKQEKEKGFINEMRRVAMKLHTKDQAPKEGEAPAKKAPGAWTPTREGYLRFLAESRAVYDVLEKVMDDAKHPEYARFKNTGLERTSALEADIKWFEETYTMKAPPVNPDGPGAAYAKLITELADKDPQAFIAHYYNFYFAHTAGGRMIGSKISQMILDNKNLEFYEYNGDMNELLDGVRRSINEMAETWSPEQKEHCLDATESSFKYSGAIMQCITSDS